MRRPLHVRVHPTLALLVALFAAAGVLGYWVLDMAADFVVRPPIAPGAGVMIALAYLVSIVIRELGHVWAFWVFRLGLASVTLAFTPGVRTRIRASNRQQVLISASGPLAGAATGAVLLTAAGDAWTPLGVAGFLILLDAVANLLPWSRRCDGGRLGRAARAVLRGSGGDRFE